MALILVHAVPAPAHPSAPLAPAGFADNSIFWLQVLTLLDRIDEVLAQQARDLANDAAACESTALDHAAATSGRFQAGGLRSGLGCGEASDALATLGELRSQLMMNPDVCMDPYWDTFLVTLDEIETALRAVLQLRGGGS
ncbi:MAG TPA: hypothetical protein VFF69_01655 [Phycisphaerales bacterium]|nr:hypothetical protein [Phycisphaerales bacterium]